MKNKKILLMVGSLTLAAAVAIPSSAFAAAPLEEQPTIKYVFDENGGERVSDEEFATKFGSTAGEAAEKTTVDTASVAMQADEKPMLYYYFGEAGAYQVTKDQFDEILENHNLEEVVTRDGLEPVSQEVSPVETESEMPTEAVARKTGSWNINSNEVKPGYRVTYSMPDGSSFVVGDGEEIVCSIKPNKACWFTAGVTGSTEYEVTNFIDMSSAYGVTLASDRPGSYKFYVENNDNGYSFKASGIVNVS